VRRVYFSTHALHGPAKRSKIRAADTRSPLQMTKSLSSRDIIRKLEADGWALDHVSGSHHIFRHPTKPGPVVVRHPRKALKQGAQRATLQQAGLLP